MQIIEVTTPNLANQFIDFQPKHYQGDKNYVQPWRHEIEEVFDEKKNKYFKDGSLSRWVVKENDTIIGRIAAFTHPKLERKNDPVGGIGFFECINNQEAANLLFDTAKAWLVERGKTSMDGPINFGERDKWWGLQVEGFSPPLYGMNYNHSYYEELFAQYGFQNYFNQYVYKTYMDKDIPERFYNVYERLSAPDTPYRFETIKINNLSKYAEDFRIIYNEAWAKAHAGFKPMRKEQAKALLKTMKPIMIKEAMIFAYHLDRPIGFFISIPNLNEIINKLNGKFGLWEKIKFLYHLKLKKSYKTLAGIIFGIIPEFQGKGIDAGLIVKGDIMLRKPGQFESIELMWIGDFNPKMMRIAEQFGAEIGKRLVTYRYLFDKNREFKRHPIINK